MRFRLRTRICASSNGVQQQLEAKDGWRMQQRVDTVLTQLQLSGDVLMKNSLAAGGAE